MPWRPRFLKACNPLAALLGWNPESWSRIWTNLNIDLWSFTEAKGKVCGVFLFIFYYIYLPPFLSQGNSTYLSNLYAAYLMVLGNSQSQFSWVLPAFDHSIHRGKQNICPEK